MRMRKISLTSVFLFLIALSSFGQTVIISEVADPGDNYKARFIAIYGATEKGNKEINIKDKDTGKEITIKRDQLYNHIITELMSPNQSCESCEADNCDDCE